MAEEADALEREDAPELDIQTEEPEVPETEDEGGSEEPVSPEGEGQEPEPEDEEIELSFGDEAAPASKGDDSGLVRKLRAEIRARDERLAALERGAQPQPQKIEVGEKPTLESCDYDEAKFETELDAWKERKAEADKAQVEAQKQQDAAKAEWAEELAGFERKKAALKVRDFEASEDVVSASLSQIQQAVLIRAADDAAKVVYALGRYPEKLAALQAIQDPIKFAAALVKLEGTLKVTTRRKAPEPEGVARGSGPLRTGEDKVLARLEAEADRTGDRTKVVQYKRQLRSKAQA